MNDLSVNTGAECFHCGDRIGPGALVLGELDGRTRAFCCHGCRLVAETIEGAGLNNFYRQRAAPAPKPDAEDLAAYSATYDHPAVENRYVRDLEGDDKEVFLLLQGVNCAACVWLIEQYVARLPGVRSADVNYTTRQARVRWDGKALRLGRLLAHIAGLGYRPVPTLPGAERELLEAEKKGLLRRLGVAAALGMQVMILAVALYTGQWWGIEPQFAAFFRWTSLVLTLPVLVYAGQPFFVGAARDLRLWRLTMDVPISLGLGAAFAASVWATVTGGDVYFDTVVMFVFFLLVARYVELVARTRASDAVHSGQALIPDRAYRVQAGGGGAPVPVVTLEPGDTILVRSGEVVPADGVIIQGSSSLDESLLTGESTPVTRETGSRVVAGSMNLEQPLTVRVTATGANTVVSGIRRLLNEAQFAKPMMMRQVDRVARWFVGGVLIVAVAVAAVWLSVDPDRALAATIAVLIVSCPCALALATPAVTAAAVGAALKRGVLVVNSRAFETLTRTTRYFFDKTGTLTRGRFDLVSVDQRADLSARECLRIAAALEQYAHHPLAAAFAERVDSRLPTVDAPEVVTGRGVSGTIDGHRYAIGKPEFANPGGTVPGAGNPDDGGTVVVLARESEPVAVFGFRDRPRPGAREILEDLKRRGNDVHMLTGDRRAVAEHIGRLLGIAAIHAGLTPQQKLARVQHANRAGEVTVMVGDGVNDAPVIGGAHVSLALGNQVDLASTAADIVVLNQDLGAIEYLLGLSTRVVRIMRQNFAWAISYNAIAIPAAALSMVPPWLAAIGMSASSLVVVLNALRAR